MRKPHTSEVFANLRSSTLPGRKRQEHDTRKGNPHLVEAACLKNESHIDNAVVLVITAPLDQQGFTKCGDQETYKQRLMRHLMSRGGTLSVWIQTDSQLRT